VVLTFYIFLAAIFGIFVQFTLALFSWASSGQFASASFNEALPYLASQVAQIASFFVAEVDLSLILNAWVSFALAAISWPVFLLVTLLYGAIERMSK
jgi:hypothetical protein